MKLRILVVRGEGGPRILRGLLKARGPPADGHGGEDRAA